MNGERKDPAQLFDCPRCGLSSAPAASFCARCAAALEAPLPRLSPARDDRFEGAHGIEEHSPWALASDGRLFYLFSESDRGAVQAKAFIGGASGAATSQGGVRADRVRGFAATRRGAFIAADDGLFAFSAPIEPDGSWGEHLLSEGGGEIVGLRGIGRRLYLLLFRTGRLELRVGSGSTFPGPVASAPWPRAEPPGWLDLHLDARAGLAWIWGSHLLGRIDLELGEMTLSPHPAAPDPVGLTIPSRRGGAGIRGRLQSTRTGAGVVATSAGGWGILDLSSGAVTLTAAASAGPLAILPLDGGALAVFPDYLSHFEVVGDQAVERRGRPHALTAATAGRLADGAVVLGRARDGAIVAFEVGIDLGRPPTIHIEQTISPNRNGELAVALDLAPQVVQGEVWLAAVATNTVELWRCAMPRGPA